MSRATDIWNKIKDEQANENGSAATGSNEAVGASASESRKDRAAAIWENISNEQSTTPLGEAIANAKAAGGASPAPTKSAALDPVYGMAPKRDTVSLRPYSGAELLLQGAAIQQAVKDREEAEAGLTDTGGGMTYTVDDARADVERLRAEQDELYRSSAPETVARREPVERQLGAAQERLASLLQREEAVSNEQALNRYRATQSNADFAEKSQFVQQALDPYDALSNRASLYDFVNDKNGARQKVETEYSRGPSYQYGDWTPYAHLSEDEKGVFNYVYATEGEDAAKEYLDYLAESLTARQGADIAERMKNAGTVSQALYGVTSGVDQFGSGIQRTIQRTFAENPQMDTTAVEYAASNILNDLDEEGKKGAEFAFKVAQMAGQMAPSILLSGAVGSILKSAGLGAKALGAVKNTLFSGSVGAYSSGNAYKTGIEQYGMNHEQAQMYANLVGASEGGLTYLLGGFGQGGALVNKLLGGNGAAKFAEKVANIDNAIARFALQFGGQLLPRMGGEAFEENAQLFLEPAFRTILTGEDYDAPEIKEIIETTLLSAVTAGLMSAPGAVGTAMQGGNAGNNARVDAHIDPYELLAGAESAQNAAETPEISGGETVAENVETAQGETSDVKLSEDAAENKNAAANASSVTVYSGKSALDNPTGLAYTLASNIHQLQDLQPVKALTGTEMNDRTKKPSEQIRDFFAKLGSSVFRPGFGSVLFGEYGVGGILNHRPLNRAKMVSLTAVPEVIQNGKIISYTENWKGRGYDSYVFAAPVTINGVPVYVAAVVNKGPGNKFYLNECVDSEGNYVRIDESTPDHAKSGFTVQDGVTAKPGVPSGINLAQTTPGVKGENLAKNSAAPEEQSVGAAPAGFEGDVERGFSRNIATDEAMDAELREDFQLDPEMYHRLANSETLRKAEAIFAKGLQEAQSVVEKALGAAQAGQKLAPEMVPLARLVANALVREGDFYSARRILSDIAVELTAAGQLGQAAAILRGTNRATMLDMMEKALANINNKLPKSSKWKAALTESEKEMIQSADMTKEGIAEEIYSQIAQRLGREMPSTLWEKAVEIRRVAMLLNPKTQIKNFVANAPLMGMRKGSEVLSGAVQGALVKMGVMDAADRTRTAFYSKQSKDIARQLYEQNKDDLKNRSNRWDMNSLLREHRRYFNDWNIGRLGTGDAIDAARTFTYWLLEQGDSPYMRSAFIDSAARYIEAQGYTSLDAVPQEVIDFAGQQALEATFKDASQLSDFINKIKRQGGLAGGALDILFPFTTTPINITRRLYDYSPLAFAKILNREFRQAGLPTQVDALSKSTVGTAVVALGFLLAKLGWITGGADDDRDKAAWDKATGKSPYSFGGRFSYDWAQPAGSLLAIGAEIKEALEGDQSAMDAIFNSLYTAGDAFLELSFFQNVLDLMKGYGSPTEQVLTEIAESGVSQMAPTLLGAIARTVDDTARTTYGADITGNETVDRILAGVMSKVPGLSQLLPESVNVKGETVKRADTWGERALYELFVPANVNVAEKTAVDQLIDDLFEATGNKNVFPNQALKEVQGEAEKLAMTGEEYEQYKKTMGQTYMDLMGALLGEDGPESLTPEQQAKAAGYIKEYANAVAKEEFLESRGEDFESTTEKQAALDDLADFFGVKAAYALAADTANDGENADFDAIEALLGDYNALSDEAKELMDNSHSRLDDIAAANAAGVSVADWDKAYTAWKGIKDNESMSPAEKATAFAAWVDTNGFDWRQRKALKELLGFSSGFNVQADNYASLTGNGLSAKDAEEIVNEILNLEPLDGEKNVSNAQKYNEILSTFRDERRQLQAFETYMPDGTYKKLTTAVDEGYTPTEFVKFYEKYSNTDAKDENGNSVSGLKKQRVLEWAKNNGFTASEAEWMYKLLSGSLD